MTKSWSCTDLHNSLYLAPNELRHCCTRFFKNGKMKGDIPLFKVKNSEDISIEKILDAKKRLHKIVNENKDSPCSGCPALKFDEWSKFNKLEVKHLSIESHSVCNLKCDYCGPIYYGGEKGNYNVQDVFNQLEGEKSFSNHISLVWGGGEPVLLENFNSIFENLTKKLKPYFNNVFTNAIVFNKTIAHFLEKGQATITTSIDAGTPETYRVVRGADTFYRVLKNLKRYHDLSHENVTIKYILQENNSSSHEVSSFVNEIKSHGLTGCSFQISTNYKNENMEEKILGSAKQMYDDLIKIGAHFINFDDHIRERVSYKIKDSHKPKDLQNIIVWGTGVFAKTLIERNPIFDIKNISHFVDSNPERIGKMMFDIDIMAPESILMSDYPIFIASSTFFREIFNTLGKMGIDKRRVIPHALV